jgi:localization factor PodJL
MKQNANLKTPDADSEDVKAATGRTGRSIDAWLDAAMAEQTARTARARGAKPEAGAGDTKAKDRARGRGEAEGLGAMVASLAGERASAPAAPAPSEPAHAPSPPSELPEAAPTQDDRHEETAGDPEVISHETQTDTSGRPALADTLKALDRMGSRLASAGEERAPASPVEDSLRGFENRIRSLSERLATPRPIARRGLSPREEVGAAVAEIRSHQAALEAGTAVARVLEGRQAAESHAAVDILAAMRADMSRLATQVEASRTPQAVDSLRREIDDLRGVLGSVAKRDDLAPLETSIRSLSGDVAELKDRGLGTDPATGRVDALEAELRAVAEGQRGLDGGRIGREIDILSHKLDMVAAAGIDPNLLGTLSAQIEEIRSLFAHVATPGDLAEIGAQVFELKQEIATLATRQVDPNEFASLKTTVEDLRDTLAQPGAPRRDDELQPIQQMLMLLVEKLDRVERQSADQDSLDGLERQVAQLARVLETSAGRDPSLATLESAMSQLLDEVASWREGAIELAERAARHAVSETLDAWSPQGPPEAAGLAPKLEALREGAEAAADRNHKSLQAVQAALEAMAHRIETLEDGERPSSPSTATREAEIPAPAAPSRIETREAAPQALRVEPTRGPDADRAPLASEEEILLEPGAERPRGSVAARVPGAPNVDQGDIKSSFIAAARRAAQAAAAEASNNRGKAGGSPDSNASGAAGAGLGTRLRTLVETHRRPLLIGAAAIVLALGTLQLAYDILAPKAPVTASIDGSVPPVTVAPPPGAVRVEAQDPQSTQSIPDNSGRESGPANQANGPSPDAKASSGEKREAAAIAPAPDKGTGAAKPDAALVESSPKLSAALPPGPAVQPASRPASAAPDLASVAALAGLRQAAANGNPVALYDLATRLAEGRGMPRDAAAAAGMFEKAAEKGLTPAQFRVGNLYEKGIGVTRNLDLAKNWYRRAAEAGNTRAMHNLAVLLAEGAGGKPDYVAATTWFQKAADQGVRDSQYNLAVLFARGLGVPQDMTKSYTWFAVAAAQGDDDAGRKRDEVASRLSPADLAKAKAQAETWKAVPANAVANEVQPPTAGWASETGSKRPSRS